MNFFQKLADLKLVGDLKMTVNTTGETLVVSLILDNQNCGDDARKIIPPLLLRGTASELDEGFFNAVGTPLQQTSGLQVSMENYLKQVEEATKKSKMNSDKEKAEKDAREAKKKVYDTAMKAVDELAKASKFREAYGKLPKPADHPDQAGAITAKQNELKAKFGQPSLFDFGSPAPAPINTPDETATDTDTDVLTEEEEADEDDGLQYDQDDDRDND